MAEQSSADFRGTLGRYALYGEIASGGMATVHLARLINAVGFSRTVAIKRLHPHLAKDPDFAAMFLEEARLAARVRHPNVVATLDVVSEGNELFLVMEYVAGESLSRLIRTMRDAGKRIPPRFVVGMMCSALEGLQAAHDATSERGVPLGIVHRDVSPQNILVGLDGVTRVLDFGIAKATNRVQETRSDQIKGKIQYMSPEQLAKGAIDRRADVYSASVVLWEALTGRRLFKADDVPALVYSIINDEVETPSSLVPALPRDLDDVVMKGLDREAANRWSTAREMAVELEKVFPPAPAREIGEWLATAAGESLAWRTELVHRIESETSSSLVPPIRDETASDVTSGVVDSLGTSGRRRPDDEEAPKRVYDEEDDRRETSMRMEVTAGTETRFREGRSRMGIVLGAVVLLFVAASALALRLIQLQTEPAPATAASSASSAQGASPTLSTATKEGERESAIGLGGARAASSDVPDASAKGSATATGPALGGPPAVLTSRTPQAAPAAAANDCENPFTMDSKGLRHPKPHCFKR